MNKSMLSKTLKKAILLLGFFAFVQNAWAEKTVQYFDISVAGFTIGEVKATKDVNGKVENYEVHSLVSLWFFGTLRIEFLMKSTYSDGLLISSDTSSSTNRGDFLTTIRWNGQRYQIDANSYKFSNQQPIEQPIYLSAAKLFFEEPKGGETFLSENYGLTCELQKLEPALYQVEIDGNRNKYIYENGELERVQMQNPIKNYQIKRRR